MLKTTAECLIELARSLKYTKDTIVPAEDMTSAELAQVKVALDFSRKPLSFKFRAIFEDWDLFQINQELY